MIALPLSILCATYLVVCFKYFERYRISTLQAIVFNYIACVFTGLILTGELPEAEVIHLSWFPAAVFLGCCFFCIFNLMGYVARNYGLTLTSVASKLSMVIPVTAAFILYHQPVTVIKVTAIVLAFPAVILSSLRNDEHASKSGGKTVSLFGTAMALVIFLGSGFNDALVNYAQEKLIAENEMNAFNIVIFSVASLLGLATLLVRYLMKKEAVPLKALAGGILLGVPNYFSLLFLLLALDYPGWNSSVIFPINNMGIVLLTALIAYFLFREHLSILNWIGMAIGLLSISLLIFA